MDITIRPSAANIPPSAATKRWIGIRIYVCLGILGILRRVLIGASVFLIASVLFAVAAFGVFLVLFVSTVNRKSANNATVFATDDTIGMTGIMGKTRTYPRSLLSRVVLCSVRTGGVATAYTIFVSGTGQYLFKIASRQWDVKDIERVCEACSVPLAGSWDDVSSPAQVNAEIAESFPRWVALVNR